MIVFPAFDALLSLCSAVANLIDKNEVQIGPLATWVSGTASFLAVAVALRGHRRVEGQRLEDKKEKLENSAHQAILKLQECVRAAHYARYSLRTRVQIVKTREGTDDEMETFYIDPLRTVVERSTPSLNSEEENLFGRLGEYEILSDLKLAIGQYASFVGAASRHEKLVDELNAKAKQYRMSGGKMVGGMFSVDDDDTNKSIAQVSSQVYIMINLSDRALKRIAENVPPALVILRSYMPRGHVDHIKTDFVELELENDMPSIEEKEADAVVSKVSKSKWGGGISKAASWLKNIGKS